MLAIALLVVLAPWTAWGATVQDGCEIAVLVLDEKAASGRPLAYNTGELTGWRMLDLEQPQDFRHLAVIPAEGAPDSAWDEAYGWRLDPPSETLATRFLASRGVSMLAACPNLGEVFKQRGVVVDPKARPRRGRDGLYRLTYFSISAPVLSDDGLEALIMEESQSGPLAGGGSVVHLRRKPGEPWRIVDRRGTYVS